MGRPKKNIVAQQRAGNPGKRKEALFRMPGDDIPIGDPPKSLTPIERKYWDCICEEIQLLNGGQRRMMVMLVTDLALDEKIDAELNRLERAAVEAGKSPGEALSYKGGSSANHLLSTKNACRNRIVKYLKELGGTTASASSIIASASLAVEDLHNKSMETSEDMFDGPPPVNIVDGELVEKDG